MVNAIKLIDKVHLQKYIYMISLFTSKKITAKEFEDLFLQIRRDDNHWLSDSFDKNIGKVLDTFFLDVSDYAPDNLYDSDDPNNISEEEFYRRSLEVLRTLKKFVI